MADFVFNIAKGAARAKVAPGTNVTILLLKTAEADATLKDYDDVAALLAGSSVEADFTNYARITGLTATETPDDTNDWVDLDLADQTWTSAGGATNNTLAKAIICAEEGAGDANLTPLVALDFIVTTDGTNLNLEFDPNGFYRAQ